MIGFDLSQDIPNEKQRAMLQYNENFAWLTNENVVIMKPNTAPKVFLHDGRHITEEISSKSLDEKIYTAKTNSLWSSLAYSCCYFYFAGDSLH